MNAAFADAGLEVFERGWLSSNNVFFAAAEDGLSTLVDSGYCSHAAQTLALVRSRLLPGGRLGRIVNTHLHSDHCGGNAALQSAFGSRVAVPAGDAAIVDAWDVDALTFRATGQSCPAFIRDESLSPGTEIRLGPFSWQVLGAPGHDPHSIVLYQRDCAVLISADALWENGFGVVFPEIEGVEAFGAVRETLNQLAGLRIDWVIPGHGAPFSNVSQALERAYRRLEGFVADPVRHAQHAGKVLVKFLLLEHRSILASDLAQWMAATPYMQTIHRLYFDAQPFAKWAQGVIVALESAGALEQRQDVIFDVSR
jgi:glyoxylase-like metal-dependent hydrolase (beta-lactamase superfamily II)